MFLEEVSPERTYSSIMGNYKYRTCSVSYTHLDVYKRQTDECVTEIVAKQKAAGLHAITDGEFRRKDVYKRQG